MATYDTAALIEMAGAAEAFLNAWAELLLSLPDDYNCTMTCGEAEAAADFLRAHGRMQVAEALIGLHAEHDDPGDSHYLGAAANAVPAATPPRRQPAVILTRPTEPA